MVGSIRILHVEDDPDLAELVATELERADDRFAVDTAGDATEGLENLAAGEYDCVVSDYDMPDRNGIEFLTDVRETDTELPFILYTGKGSEAVASEAISAGVTDYLQKEGGLDHLEVLANRIANAVDQYRARRAQAETERKLSELAEKTDDVLYMFSGDWSELLFVNSAFEDIWGVPIERIQADPDLFLEYIHPDDRAEARESMARLSNGEAVEIEYRVTPPDGDLRWIRGDSKPIVDDEDTVQRIVGFVRDITEEKEREQALREEQAFLDQSLDALQDVFFVFDTGGRFLRWNERLETVSGYDEAAIREMEPVDFFPEDHAERILTGIEEVLETGSATVQADIQTAAGDRIPYEFAARKLTNPDGDLLGLAGVGRDISARLDRQRAIEAQNERLEEFAGLVSHDLRNPLNVVKTRLELARDEVDSEHLEAMGNALDRMERIIDDMLWLAREGQDIGETESVALRAATDAAWTIVTDDRGPAVVRISEPVGSRRLVADRGRLVQLLENLFRNAIEHAGEDVTVRVGTTADGFYVEDDGPGIPEAERERVFEPGYTTVEDGTGFGLRIVAQIVDAHLWDVAVTSGSDGGARFEITGVEFAD